MPIPDLGKIYTDQTGWFPVTSCQGNKYVLSYTLTRPMPSLQMLLKAGTATDIL